MGLLHCKGSGFGPSSRRFRPEASFVEDSSSFAQGYGFEFRVWGLERFRKVSQGKKGRGVKLRGV